MAFTGLSVVCIILGLLVLSWEEEAVDSRDWIENL